MNLQPSTARVSALGAKALVRLAWGMGLSLALPLSLPACAQVNISQVTASATKRVISVTSSGSSAADPTRIVPGDALFPGIPGGPAKDLTNFFACGIVTLIEFPQAGTYRMGVTSDDGFRTSAGSPLDAVPLILGQFEGTRTAADTTFAFVIPEAGLYPLSTVFEQGQSNACLEWWSLTTDPTGIHLGFD